MIVIVTILCTIAFVQAIIPTGCKAVVCRQVRCGPGYVAKKVGNDCCASCVKVDPCAGISCPLYKCASPAYLGKINPTDCCRKCVSDCSSKHGVVKHGSSGIGADGCNTCSCNNGKWGACTRKICNIATKPPAPAPTPEPFKSCTVNGKTYSHGDSYPAGDGCNTCKCTDGTSGCTKVACNQDCRTDKGTEIKHNGDGPSDDGCNTCSCTNGLLRCTLLACLPKKDCQTAKGTTIKHEEQGKADDGCNTCTCSDGALACSEIACNSPTPRDCETRDGTVLKHGASAPAGDGCNTCKCSDGNLSCTEAECSGKDCKTAKGMTIRNGSEGPADDGCNKCSCINGQLACTELACTCANVKCEDRVCTEGQTKVKDESGCCFTCADDNGSNEPATCTVDGVTKMSGESWKQDCNVCSCNDGRVACTKKGCGEPNPDCNLGDCKKTPEGCRSTVPESACRCWTKADLACKRVVVIPVEWKNTDDDLKTIAAKIKPLIGANAAVSVSRGDNGQVEIKVESEVDEDIDETKFKDETREKLEMSEDLNIVEPTVSEPSGNTASTLILSTMVALIVLIVQA